MNSARKKADAQVAHGGQAKHAQGCEINHRGSEFIVPPFVGGRSAPFGGPVVHCGETMKHFAIVSLALLLAAPVANSQFKGGRPSRPFFDSTATPRIVTKVPFNGGFYSIMIVPVDTSNIDNMPIFTPYPQFGYPGKIVRLRRDSLQHLLPDSVLKLSPVPKERQEHDLP